MRNWLAIVFFGVVVSIAAGAASQEDVGDPAAGALVAADICASCHGVSPGDITSPNPDAPPFQAVAETPGMTATALFAWLTTTHPTMPNIILETDDRRNVVAYVLSLRGAR
jgi:mono/diheme cytochrome c family protein